MATNPVVSGGLRLYKPASQNNQAELVLFSASESNNIFIGDAVILASGGSDQIAPGPYVQQVTKADASSAIYGIVLGFLPHWTSGSGSISFNQQYRPASTKMYALIRPANNQDEYVIMDDGTLASGARGHLGADNVGLNANLTVATAGSTATGMSNMQLGGASAATTATLQLKIWGVAPENNNDPTAINCRWIVKVNKAVQSGGTGTAGV